MGGDLSGDSKLDGGGVDCGGFDDVSGGGLPVKFESSDFGNGASYFADFDDGASSFSNFGDGALA